MCLISYIRVYIAISVHGHARLLIKDKFNETEPIRTARERVALIKIRNLAEPIKKA